MLMQKYFQVMQGMWHEYMAYRLNFVMWRVRMVLQLLVTYFLWSAIFQDRTTLFGYNQSLILTYILLSSVVRTFVLGTTTMEIGSIINRGELSNYLLRPLSFFKTYIAKDIADKVINAAFAVIEICILYIVLRPPVFIQTNPNTLIFSLCAVVIGVLLFFWFSMILGMLGFWTPDVWAPRFLSFVVIEFFAGGLFPIDILPEPLFAISRLLPFSYFIYFPLKVYLGQLPITDIVTGITIGVFWIGGLWYGASLLWREGLKVYTAEGR